MKNVKVFGKTVDQEVYAQIEQLTALPQFADCKIRVMPDCHVGKGCVIGFTADMGDMLIPDIVGVDIGCGMYTVNIGKKAMNLKKLDDIFRDHIPFGREIRKGRIASFSDISAMKAYRELKGAYRFDRAIGTLGGGNHFIEVDIDEDGCYYLIVHSGSRNMGLQVANYYQNLAFRLMQGEGALIEAREKLIEEYKQAGKSEDIAAGLKQLNVAYKCKKVNIPRELCHLDGRYREAYLHDMRICQKFASFNRKTIADVICDEMGLKQKSAFETVHNYLDFDSNIIRKGAISAQKDEPLLIPINMRDGCIFGVGKGNEDWNFSAPHGAGRLMSRRQAKESINLQDYKETMKDIFTSCVNPDTLDEAPFVYKPMSEIIAAIEPSVKIEKILRPVYNFKASE